ncbi:phage shock protein PspA [Labrys miyagiensis]|uniref:Phage shock protein PspA n=1 Tax=Labrys miyagiensis TaxID=346912 RepID=A0ABQ6CXV1_9HYPH|nr:PspA/IM30 family protein [Labrys miyagiensis]GLS23097.1 phage shock protein PspA [Labrys miyagiensis]
MSILGRVADLFTAKTHKLLNALEDPNEVLDLSYEKMLSGLQETKAHLADVIAQQKSLERQITTADHEIAGAEDDAATAVKAERDDLAKAALVHRRRAMDNRATLEQALNAILPQISKLTDYQQRLQERIEKFRTQKETMKASYAAAQAQVKAQQSLTGIGERLGGVGETYQRAEDRMLATRDKADAMDSMIEQGIVNDPLDKRSSAEKELAALRDKHAVDDDLAALKAQLGPKVIGSSSSAGSLPKPEGEAKE